MEIANTTAQTAHNPASGVEQAAKRGGAARMEAERENAGVKAQQKAAQRQAEETAQTQQSLAEQRQEVMDLVEEMNRNMSPLSTKIRFGFNETINGLFVNVMDADTNSVIRQIPSEEAITLTDKMREVVGMLFDKTI